jgi:hypothetical protein
MKQFLSSLLFILLFSSCGQTQNKNQAQAKNNAQGIVAGSTKKWQMKQWPLLLKAVSGIPK